MSLHNLLSTNNEMPTKGSTLKTFKSPKKTETHEVILIEGGTDTPTKGDSSGNLLNRLRANATNTPTKVRTYQSDKYHNVEQEDPIQEFNDTHPRNTPTKLLPRFRSDVNAAPLTTTGKPKPVFAHADHNTNNHDKSRHLPRSAPSTTTSSTTTNSTTTTGPIRERRKNMKSRDSSGGFFPETPRSPPPIIDITDSDSTQTTPTSSTHSTPASTTLPTPSTPPTTPIPIKKSKTSSSHKIPPTPPSTSIPPTPPSAAKTPASPSTNPTPSKTPATCAKDPPTPSKTPSSPAKPAKTPASPAPAHTPTKTPASPAPAQNPAKNHPPTPPKGSINALLSAHSARITRSAKKNLDPFFTSLLESEFIPLDAPGKKLGKKEEKSGKKDEKKEVVDVEMVGEDERQEEKAEKRKEEEKEVEEVEMEEEEERKEEKREERKEEREGRKKGKKGVEEVEMEEKKEEEYRTSNVDLTTDTAPDRDINLSEDEGCFFYSDMIVDVIKTKTKQYPYMDNTPNSTYNLDENKNNNTNNYDFDYNNNNNNNNNSNNNNNNNTPNKKDTNKRKLEDLTNDNDKPQQPAQKPKKNARTPKKDEKTDSPKKGAKTDEVTDDRPIYYSPYFPRNVDRAGEHFNVSVVIPPIDPDTLKKHARSASPPTPIISPFSPSLLSGTPSSPRPTSPSFRLELSQSPPPSPPPATSSPPHSPFLTTPTPPSPPAATLTSPAKPKQKSLKTDPKLQNSPKGKRSKIRKSADGDEDFDPIKDRYDNGNDFFPNKTKPTKPKKAGGRPPKEYNKNNPIDLDATDTEAPPEKEEPEIKNEVEMTFASAQSQGISKHVESTLVFKPHALVLRWEGQSQEILVKDIHSCSFHKEDDEMKLELLDSAQLLKFLINNSEPPKSSRTDPDKPVVAKFSGLPKDFDPAQIAALSSAWKDICSKESHAPHKPVTRKDTKEPVKTNTNSKKLSEVLVNFPPPPHLEGVVTVTRYDYNMLDPTEFLNDTIIEFYLKFIYHKIMPKDHQSKFYFFNTFFFEKLSRDRKGAYNEIQSWTNKVDIFTYDFLIVPINESSHWSLIVVCHPGSVPEESTIQKQIGQDETANKKTPKPGEPCIIYLDSLSGKKKAIYKIRDYLTKEWQARKANKGDKPKKFTGNNMPLYQPPVPNQENYYDCGLFLLHYVEKFAHDPDVTSFTKDWFPNSEIEDKRKDIRSQIDRLHAEQHPEGETNSDDDPEKEIPGTASSDLMMFTQPTSSMLEDFGLAEEGEGGKGEEDEKEKERKGEREEGKEREKEEAKEREGGEEDTEKRFHKDKKQKEKEKEKPKTNPKKDKSLSSGISVNSLEEVLE